MIKVSFIIVAFNSERAIHFSLDSLKKQNYPHDKIEVILVDGMSSDCTKQTMIDFQNKESSFDRVLVLDNPKRILSSGWNVALRNVTGDIIIRVDAHTVFPTDFISANVDIINRGESISGGRVVSILEKDSSLGQLLLEVENSMFGGGFTFFRRGEVERYTSTLAFAAYRRDVFNRVGYYNESLVRTEDNEMHYRMRKAGFRFFFTPKIVSYRYSRSTIKSLLKQKYLNGYWVGLTMGVAPRAFSPAYFIPLLFVCSLLLCVAIIPFTVVPLIALLCAYGLVLMASMAASLIKGYKHLNILLMPILLFSLHIVYGVGTMVGLLRIPWFIRTNKQ